MSQLARLCFHNRRCVVVLWLVGLVAVGLAGSILGGAFLNDFRVAGAESQASYGQLRRNTDKRNRHRHAALCLATTVLIIGRLINWRDRRNPA